MKTFNAWWIANFEAIINILLIVIFEGFLFQMDTLPEADRPKHSCHYGTYIHSTHKGCNCRWHACKIRWR